MKQLFAAGFFFALCWCSSTVQAQGHSLPAFSFIENYPLAADTIAPDSVEGSGLVVCFFDPEYEPCKLFASGLESNPLPKDITMIWVSWSNPEDNVAFAKAHPKLGANHHFAKDTQAKIDVWFGHCEIPSVWVFNSEGKRIKMFYNMVPDKVQLDEALSRLR